MTDNPYRQTPRQRLERLEQAIERWKRKPASRRQRLILASYRRAASELRKRVAARDNYPTTPELLTRGSAEPAPEMGTYSPPAPYRVFRVIRNPAPGQSRDRRLTRAALRIVKD